MLTKKFENNLHVSNNIVCNNIVCNSSSELKKCYPIFQKD